MANWVLIENGEIIEYHDLLPKNWRHISGLNLSSDNLEFLKSLGWYKVKKSEENYDNSINKLIGYIYTIEQDYVTETCNLVEITTDEKDIARQNNIVEFFTRLRRERDKLLQNSDWTQLKDIVDSHTPEWNDAWKDYRQKLRDLPSLYSEDNITDINWPTIP